MANFLLLNQQRQMKSFYLFLFSTLLCGLSCKSESTNDQTGPESTFIQWQKYVDVGDFAKAKSLSTTTTILWLQEIAEIDADDSSTTKNILTNIKNISCTLENDTAYCSYQILEEGETLSNSIQLVKLKGEWLVDIHDDPDEFLDD